MARFDVVIAGEANLDLLLYGLPEDLPLERELLADAMHFALGGSSAITAHNLAALGCRVGFISRTADDAFAGMACSELANMGVDLSRTVAARPGMKTGVSVLLEHGDTRRTLTYPGTTATLQFADLDLEYIRSARHLHLSSYFLQRDLQPDVARLLRFCKEQGMSVSLDPNDDPSGEWGAAFLELLPWVDVLMPNERELCHLAHEDDVEQAVERISQRVPLLVVKRGRRGAIAVRGMERVAVPALVVASVDAVGAGDSFNAGFLFGYLRHWGLERCVHLGNSAGAFSTTAAGGTLAFRNRAALAAFLERNGEPLLEAQTSPSLNVFPDKNPVSEKEVFES
ncbi:MAG TPA: sugar kinase [Acidobacteriaceae bacterium]|nr:sugar kinase [Acidobacteriaceae bacterium]